MKNYEHLLNNKNYSLRRKLVIERLVSTVLFCCTFIAVGYVLYLTLLK